MALAIFLCVFGIFSLVAAWLHFTQRILGKHEAVSCVPGGVCGVHFSLGRRHLPRAGIATELPWARVASHAKRTAGQQPADGGHN